MIKTIVLGAEMAGIEKALDFLENNMVTIADFNNNLLLNAKENFPEVNTLQIDLFVMENIEAAIKNFDLVVCSVPKMFSLDTMKTVIEAGKNVIDLSVFA